MTDKLKLWSMSTPVGTIYLAASIRGLEGVFWKKPKAGEWVRSLAGPDHGTKTLAHAELELSEYFAGKRTRFTVPLAVDGTEFQKEVWAQLAKIPYGQTLSYRDVAKRVGREKAVRAVGTANGRNPISIIVPCHRVIAADGTLGGYAGGLATKTKLLELEAGVRSLG